MSGVCACRATAGLLTLPLDPPSEEDRGDGDLGGAWSDVHDLLVLCLVCASEASSLPPCACAKLMLALILVRTCHVHRVRGCGASSEDAVGGVITPLHQDGVCPPELEEVVLSALRKIPSEAEPQPEHPQGGAGAGSSSGEDWVRKQPMLGRVMAAELRSMNRGGISKGYGYEF